MIPEMYVTFPLPIPSSPASWADVTNTGNGERGTGNVERGTGNGDQESGN